MDWAVPEYDKGEIDGAGRHLAKIDFPVSTNEGVSALKVINNWRSAHSYPLNTFQITLRNRARKIERTVIVAQRIKRLESIHAKLSRQPTMRMSQMQDIAGCRAVLKNVRDVRRLVKRYKESRFDHKFRGEKDYITQPKPEGYRCHHLVYEYRGTAATSAYDGTKVEIQIRSQLQHAWATAVEAVGIFTKQALKSSQGDEDWLRFFALMGSAIAAIEGCNPVPGTPTDKEKLASEIEELAAKLHVSEMLMAYNTTIEHVSKVKGAKYFLLRLEPDPAPGKITVAQYKARESEVANAQYTEMESAVPDGSSIQVVLVSVDNINALRRAYPNYFLDTEKFTDQVDRVLRRDFPDPLPHPSASDIA
ncbi:RelA/SpoT domain-containing protein [Sulfitobacter sp. LCG007]